MGVLPLKKAKREAAAQRRIFYFSRSRETAAVRKTIASSERFILQIKARWGRDGGPGGEGEHLARKQRGSPSPQQI